MPPLLFAAAITALDLAIFGACYAVHNFVVKDFPVLEALKGGGYLILWRLMILQVPLQLLLMWALFRTRLGHSWPIALVAAVTAFLIAGALQFKDFTKVLLLFKPMTLSLSEGLALLVSVSLAWLMLAPLRERYVAA